MIRGRDDAMGASDAIESSDGVPRGDDDETTKPHRSDRWEDWLTMWFELGLACCMHHDSFLVDPVEGWEDRVMARLRGDA
jgi:hypothetical protein